jgi:hypothetical protein
VGVQVRIVATIEYDESRKPLSGVPAFCREIRAAIGLVDPDARVRIEVDPGVDTRHAPGLHNGDEIDTWEDEGGA